MPRFAFRSPNPASTDPIERFIGRVLAWLSWAVLAGLGLLFLLALLAWLLVMALISLVSGWITGRPSTASQLWQVWRQTARQRWGQTRQTRPGQMPSGPDTDAAPHAPARREKPEVQDVSWRELPVGDRDDTES